MTHDPLQDHSGHHGPPGHGHHGVTTTQPQGQTGHGGHGGHDHSAMVADFRRRFWVTLVLTPPVLLLSPMIQHWFGLADTLRFSGDSYVLFTLSTIAYLYGGWPFLNGFTAELRKGQPGMMTLIALAI